ncbi:C-C motif chemokine 20a.3 [Acanthochromis polyacanthus]|uniref:C-C motif chemokine 20a.3 n=1 Tax=Acanthochromis polyacanthus TaxID=80966 RepID=UPI002234CAB6|nr:C-C motif chemokine 20a.3 [Acanthochromis polyacanthus]
MVSVRLTVMAITLVTLCLVATNEAVSSRCCSKYMTVKLPFRIIKGYSVQTVTEMCPLDAIIFHTSKGKACTDPALKWVIDYVEILREKAQLVHKTSQALK